MIIPDAFTTASKSNNKTPVLTGVELLVGMSGTIWNQIRDELVALAEIVGRLEAETVMEYKRV